MSDFKVGDKIISVVDFKEIGLIKGNQYIVQEVKKYLFGHKMIKVKGIKHYLNLVNFSLKKASKKYTNFLDKLHSLK